MEPRPACDLRNQRLLMKLRAVTWLGRVILSPCSAADEIAVVSLRPSVTFATSQCSVGRRGSVNRARLVRIIRPSSEV